MEPIPKNSLADAVSDRIASLIKEGKYRVGDRLPTERELAKQFGVGRTSIREGLRYLEKLGALDIHQGKGIIVRSVSLDEVFQHPAPISAIIILPEKEIRDIMDARRMLELESAYMAANERTEDHLRRLEELIEDMKLTYLDKPQEWLELDQSFHVAIAQASGNVVLVHLINLLWDIFFTYSETILHNSAIVTSSTRFHEEIYAAIAAKNAKLARKLMFAHLEESQRFVLSSLQASSQD
jgi:GntR family transcriptional repressor for pyruvate dehydrogenase complex